MGRSSPNIYSPSAGDQLIPGATAIDQFGALSSGGTLLSHGLDALCGWASAEITYAWAKGVAPTRDHIFQVFQQALAQGLTVGKGAKQGVSTPQTVSKELSQNLGIPNYVTHDWESAIEQYAGSRPIEVMTQSPDHNLGAELPGDEYHVTGHFYVVEGYSPSHHAFVVSDPDNSAAKSGQLVYYTLDEMRAGGAAEAIVPQLQSGGIASGNSASAATGQPLAATGSIPVISGLGQGAQNLIGAAAQNTGISIGAGIASGLEGVWQDILAGLGAKQGGANFVERLAIGAAGVAVVGFGIFVMVHEATSDVADNALGDNRSPATGTPAKTTSTVNKLKKAAQMAEVAA